MMEGGQDMPEISVIVPVFRAEAYLEECIDSILTQTFFDIQVILVDDGSPDQCGAICDAYAQRDSRIHVLHQPNQGQAAARNHALPMAQGKWLCFVDSDDKIHPQMLELLYRAVKETGAGIAMCQMLEAPALPEDFERPRSPEYTLLNMDEETLIDLYQQEKYPGWVACAKLIRREYVEAYPFQEGRVYEDNEAVCHWLLPAKTLAALPEAMYFYRTNPDSTTQGKFTLKKLDYLWALEGIIGYYRSSGYDRLAAAFLERYVDAVENDCYDASNRLGSQELSRKIAANCRRFLRHEGLKLTKRQRLRLLDAVHPELMKRFWFVAQRLNGLRKKEGSP